MFHSASLASFIILIFNIFAITKYPGVLLSKSSLCEVAVWYSGLGVV